MLASQLQKARSVATERVRQAMRRAHEIVELRAQIGLLKHKLATLERKVPAKPDKGETYFHWINRLNAQ